MEGKKGGTPEPEVSFAIEIGKVREKESQHARSHRDLTVLISKGGDSRTKQGKSNTRQPRSEVVEVGMEGVDYQRADSGGVNPLEKDTGEEEQGGGPLQGRINHDSGQGLEDQRPQKEEEGQA